MKRLCVVLTMALLFGWSMAGCGRSSRPVSQTAGGLTTNGVTATLSLQSDWGTGYCANVILVNSGSAAVTSWTLVVDLAQSTMTQMWNASSTQSGTQLTVTPASWAASIAVGASVSFGFCGTATGSNYHPALVSLAVNGGGGNDSGDSGDDGGEDSDDSSIGTVSCAGYPVWNSQVVYNTTGQLVEYNCKLYENQGYAYNVNPETNNGEYYQWLLVGTCSESDCAMGEGPWIACGNWDHWTSGDYEVYNNIWGSGAGPQCITAWSGSHWTVNSTQPATSGVKSYPNSGFVNLGKKISSLNTLTSSFNITVPSGGDWEAAYDIWVPTEVMLWMYTVGNVGPIASSWDSNGNPIPSATNVTVGGHTWNVYHQNGDGNVVSFVRTTNTTSGTVDIKAILSWIIAQGWFGDGTIGAVQFGFEISGTDGVAKDFTTNSFSITAN
jgi:hypothetical protein